MLVITDKYIYKTESGEGVERKNVFEGDYISKCINIISDLNEEYPIHESFSDLKSGEAQIKVDAENGIIEIKVSKDGEVNIIFIEKKNKTFITTNQQYIYADTNLKSMIVTLLRGYVLV